MVDDFPLFSPSLIIHGFLTCIEYALTFCNMPQVEKVLNFGFPHFMAYSGAFFPHPFCNGGVTVCNVLFYDHSCGQQEHQATLMANKFHPSTTANFICLSRK